MLTDEGWRTAALVGVAVVAAAAGHWALRRLGRRLPRHLARRAGRAISPGTTLPWEGVIQVVVLLLQTTLWLGVARFVTDRFAVLRSARERFVEQLVVNTTKSMFTINGRIYSAVDLLELPLILLASWLVIGALTRLFEVHVLRATRMEPGLRAVVASLTRYALAFVAAIVTLQAWGIDASSLTFVASVLGVGVGFGLQHIANNFVSGVVVGLERSIQPGDFVKVGQWTGTVERINPRSTEIRTLDRVSILVPNSRFLETEVVNWSHGDPVSRLHVPVGVAYGSDVARVRAALFEAARTHPDVLADPRPRVEFRSFGDNALQFELLVWTRDPRSQFRLLSDLNYRIEAGLRRHGIQVPFPQRDVHIHAPELEQVLGAWGRRQFTADELAGTSGHGRRDSPQPATGDGAPSFEDDLGPRNWTDEQVRGVVDRMRAPDGLAIADRRHLFSVYPECFVGREAVDWMTRSLGLSRQEAIELGRLLVDRGIVHHVLDEHGFADGHFFYRFRADETPGVSPTRA